MKTIFLLPRKCRCWGYLLFVLSALWGVYILFIEESCWDNAILFDALQAVKTNVAIIGTLAGLCLVAFAKERVEDELVMSLRMDAMLKSLFLNSLLIALLALFCYGSSYVLCLSCSQYAMLLLYIVIFRYNMYRHLKDNEE